MLKIEPYSQDRKEDWENLLARSKNGTFLHSRNFMEYHGDRFPDMSLMLYEGGDCVAILPAHRVDDYTVSSHNGLTYGGIIVGKTCYSKNTIAYFSLFLRYFHSQGVRFLTIKLPPDFYCSVTQQEIEFGLFMIGADLVNMDLTCAVDLKGESIAYQGRRIRGAKKASEKKLVIREEKEFSAFWEDVLIPTLKSRHGIAPVHTLEEIRYLYQRNKPSIRQFNVYAGEKVVAGTTIFETETTAHAQYISASPQGRTHGALDLLFIHLIDNVFTEKSYFDFGKVDEDGPETLNLGLLEWKEGFGARGFVHRMYRVSTKSYQILDDMLGK